MPEVAAQRDLDQVIWTDYVELRNQREVGERRGMPQRTVSDAIRRYINSIPPEEKAAYRERTMERFERVYQAWKDKADTSTRAANVVIRTLALQAHLLGLAPREVNVQHGGTIEHEHWTPGPTTAEILEHWRQQGWLRPTAELTRNSADESLSQNGDTP
jgi:hypothetical protein